MPFAIGGNQLDTGYQVDNSLRLNDDDQAHLTRTNSSAGNQKTMTWSFWVKRSTIAQDFAGGPLFGCGTVDGDEFTWSFRSNAIYLRWKATNGTSGDFTTTQKLRDCSAWYHIMLALDSTQGTNTNRVKFYLNGNQITNFNESNYPAQNIDFKTNGTVEQSIGEFPRTSGTLDGYLTEYYFIDGSQKQPSDFGEFNDNGVWIPKAYEGTFGSNGYYLDFEDASNFGKDVSGNSNNWSPQNFTATDLTTDTCTNNFNTLNPLVPHHTIFNDTTEGNTGLSSSGVQLRGGHFGTTIMPSNGKWYFEVKILSTGSSDRTGLSIANFESVVGDDHIEGGDFKGFTISTGTLGRIFVTDGSSTAETDISGYQFFDDDIAIFAVDMDATTPRVYAGKNGTWFTTSAASGGNPATNTGFFEVKLGNHFSVGARHSAGTSTSQSYLFNFGQPAFTISSGNSDSEGYGNFEFAVPSGYFAINTKNLSEYG